MTPTAAISVCVQLHVAAERDWGESTELLYEKALADVPDEVAETLVAELIRHVSWDNPPSTGMVVKHAQAIMRRRREETPAIPEATGVPLSAEENLEMVRRVREGWRK